VICSVILVRTPTQLPLNVVRLVVADRIPTQPAAGHGFPGRSQRPLPNGPRRSSAGAAHAAEAAHRPRGSHLDSARRTGGAVAGAAAAAAAAGQRQPCSDSSDTLTAISAASGQGQNTHIMSPFVLLWPHCSNAVGLAFVGVDVEPDPVTQCCN